MSLGGGGIRRGLHIDDDDEKEKYQKTSFQANRKKTNFENNLDDMLFGGGPKRSPKKPAQNVNKSVEKNTSNTAVVVQPVNNVPVTVQPANSGTVNVKPATTPTVVQPPATNTTNQSSVTISINQNTNIVSQNQGNNQTNNNNNRSTGSGKNVVTDFLFDTKTKVEVKQTKTTITNNKNQASIIVPPSNQSKKQISSIGLQTKKNIPSGNNSNSVNNSGRQPSPPKINNYVTPAYQSNNKPAPKKELNNQSAQQRQPQKPAGKQQPQQRQPQKPAVISQPARQEENISFEEKLTGVSFRNLFNKPSYVRKLKKIAEDFKFAQENVTLHTSVDVVRPFQTDRNRQRKLNDYDFRDYQFSSTSYSLGQQHKEKESTWKKPKQLSKVVNFGKYIDPNDLNPGVLSSPHFVSTLSALAQFQINTKRLIQDQKANQNGFYLVRLFVNSVWRYIAVDNSLPFIGSDNAGVLSNTDSEFELSSALIEKAYAKSFGGYDVFSRVQPRQNILRDLTGAPTKKYSTANPDLNNIVKKALSEGQIVLAVPNEKLAALGLNSNFSYIVINSTSKGSFELRNSFGSIDQRPKLSSKAEGTFELNSNQIRDVLSHVIVSQIHIDYATTTIQSKHRRGFYSSYNFNIKKNAHGYLTASQWDSRLFPANSGYQYSPFHIVLVRTENDGSSTYVNSGFTSGQRNLDLQVNLAPGSYTVFVNGDWTQNQHNYNLTFYGSQRVDFQRVYNQKVPNLISHGLQHINIQQGARSELSKTSVRYLLHHHDSNLVILTIQNTSDRSSSVTADLSRVKLDSLTLLSSHNNEDNYSNKIGSQVDEYKQIPLQNRRWSVNLQGKQAFTWIFSSGESFSEGNLKRWGF